MREFEIQVKINCAKREVEYWEGVLERKQCRGCANWDGSGCALAGGIMPPLDVQKTGCPEWLWDCIPF